MIPREQSLSQGWHSENCSNHNHGCTHGNCSNISQHSFSQKTRSFFPSILTSAVCFQKATMIRKEQTLSQGWPFRELLNHNHGCSHGYWSSIPPNNSSHKARFLFPCIFTLASGSPWVPGGSWATQPRYHLGRITWLLPTKANSQRRSYLQLGPGGFLALWLSPACPQMTLDWCWLPKLLSPCDALTWHAPEAHSKYYPVWFLHLQNQPSRQVSLTIMPAPVSYS